MPDSEALALARREALEEAAGLADEAARYDERCNGAAATGAADGLGDRIRALSASPVARERDQIVAWLLNMKLAESGADYGLMTDEVRRDIRRHNSFVQSLADAIERGDHLPPRSDRPSEG